MLSIKIKPKYIISYKNPIRIMWDYIIIILAIWNSFMMPFEFAFLHGQHESPMAL